MHFTTDRHILTAPSDERRTIFNMGTGGGQGAGGETGETEAEKEEMRRRQEEDKEARNVCPRGFLEQSAAPHVATAIPNTYRPETSNLKS